MDDIVIFRSRREVSTCHSSAIRWYGPWSQIEIATRSGIAVPIVNVKFDSHDGKNSFFECGAPNDTGSESCVAALKLPTLECLLAVRAWAYVGEGRPNRTLAESRSRP